MSTEHHESISSFGSFSRERLVFSEQRAAETANFGDAPTSPLRECAYAKAPARGGDSDFYRWSNRLSSKLIDLRRDFGGDLDQFLLQLVFVQADMSRALKFGSLSRSTAPEGACGPGLNALSIADITSISRETTRRKLKILAEGGFLRRGPDGLHYLSERYGRDRFASDFSPLYLAGRAAED